jgi:hypothetical protein
MVIHRNKHSEQTEDQTAIENCNNDNGVLLANFIVKQTKATDSEKQRELMSSSRTHPR